MSFHKQHQGSMVPLVWSIGSRDDDPRLGVWTLTDRERFSVDKDKRHPKIASLNHPFMSAFMGTTFHMDTVEGWATDKTAEEMPKQYLKNVLDGFGERFFANAEPDPEEFVKIVRQGNTTHPNYAKAAYYVGAVEEFLGLTLEDQFNIHEETQDFEFAPLAKRTLKHIKGVVGQRWADLMKRNNPESVDLKIEGNKEMGDAFKFFQNLPGQGSLAQARAQTLLDGVERGQTAMPRLRAFAEQFYAGGMWNPDWKFLDDFEIREEIRTAVQNTASLLVFPKSEDQNPGEALLAGETDKFGAFLEGQPLTQVLDRSQTAQLKETAHSAHRSKVLERQLKHRSLRDNESDLLPLLDKDATRREVAYEEFVNKVADRGAFLLRNIFARALQDAEFERTLLEKYVSNPKWSGGIFRASMCLKNLSTLVDSQDTSDHGLRDWLMRKILAPVDTDSREPATKKQKTDDGSWKSPEDLNTIQWVFIVSVTKFESKPATIFIHRVHNLSEEFAESIAPLFTPIQGGVDASYLDPAVMVPKPSKAGVRNPHIRFLGGTPFKLSDTVDHFTVGACLAYTAGKPRVAAHLIGNVWKNDKNARVAIRNYWKRLLSRIGYEKYHSGEHDQGYIQDMLRAELLDSETRRCVMAFTGRLLRLFRLHSTSDDPMHAAALIPFTELKQLLDYLAFDKSSGILDDPESPYLPRSQFVVDCLVELMIATCIHMRKDGIVFTQGKSEDKVYQRIDLYDCLRKLAAMHDSTPSVRHPYTSEELIPAIMYFDSQVMDHVAGLAEKHYESNVARYHVDVLRVQLLRLAYTDTSSAVEEEFRKNAKGWDAHAKKVVETLVSTLAGQVNPSLVQGPILDLINPSYGNHRDLGRAPRARFVPTERERARVRPQYLSHEDVAGSLEPKKGADAALDERDDGQAGSRNGGDGDLVDGG